MKKTLCMLTLMGASVAAMAQDNQMQVKDDGRMAAQDMINMQHTANFPILQTYVPDEVVSNAKNTYGERLYAIKQVKSGDGEDVYHVTLIDDGQSSVAWLGATGSEVAYVYRTDDNNAAMANRNTNTTDNNTNTTDAQPADVNAEPAADDMSQPANTLDATPAQPQSIDDNYSNNMNSTDLNTNETSVEMASPETTPNASEAIKPEDEDL